MTFNAIYQPAYLSVQAYLESYADAFGIRPHIRFGTEVKLNGGGGSRSGTGGGDGGGIGAAAGAAGGNGAGQR